MVDPSFLTDICRPLFGVGLRTSAVEVLPSRVGREWHLCVCATVRFEESGPDQET